MAVMMIMSIIVLGSVAIISTTVFYHFISSVMLMFSDKT